MFGDLFFALGGGSARVLLRQPERRWSGKVSVFGIQLTNEAFVEPRRDRVAVFAPAESWSFYSFYTRLAAA